MKNLKRQILSRKCPLWIIVMLLIIGNGVLSAKKEKPGAIIEVQKKDGQTIKGELLTVRNGILNLLIHEDATKVDVHLDELSSIRIVKKDHARKGAWIGALAGAANGALLGFASGTEKKRVWGIFGYTKTITAREKAAVGAGIFGFAGLVIGTITGALSGTDKIIQLDAMSPEKLKLVEAKLDARARFRSLPVAEPLIAPLPEPIPATPQVNGHPTLGSPTSAPAEGRVTSRWHISIIPGIFYSQGGGKLARVINRIGFGDTKAYSPYYVWLFGTQPGGSHKHPSKDPASHFVWKDIRIEYSLNQKLAVGLAYSPLGRKTVYEPRGKHRITGFKYMERIENSFDEWYDNGVHLYSGFWGNAYFMTAAFVPLPDAINKKMMFKLGAGVGFGSIHAAFSEEAENSSLTAKVDERKFTRKIPSLTVFMQFDHLLGRHLSLGLNLDFKYVPFHVDAFKLTVPYTFYSTHETVMVAADIPGFRMNIGGFGAGVSLGYHF